MEGQRRAGPPDRAGVAHDLPLRSFRALGNAVRATLLVMSSLLGLMGQASAALPDWGREPYAYVTVDQELQQVLREFAANIGVTIQVSPRVQGMVRGRLPSLPPEQFLELLARTYGLLWYYDGIVLYVNALDEVESRMIKLNTISVDTLARSLVELDIDDPRFPWTVSEGPGILYVAGPPRYVQLVTQTAELLDGSQAVRIDIRVFPLKYANSADRRFSVRGQEIIVPGVTTILRRLVNADQQGSDNDSRFRRRSGSSTMTTVGGGGDVDVATLAAVSAQRAEAAAAQAERFAGRSPAQEGDTDVQIESDSRLNAVIVKDLADRMPIYERLIASLDKPQKLVEVELVIADINSTRLEDLGVDWRLGFDSGSTNIDVGVGNPASAALQNGLTFATAITGNPFSFLSRIRALEDTGDARVLSRPTIMTFDNVEALFDQSESFFVRLEGQDEVNLVEVQAGLLVKVTPHLIVEADRTKVQMLIDIEDGSFRPLERVDDLPVVVKATLSTQGIVGPQQAMVVGGFYRERQIDNLAKVPVLGDIPLIGWTLFRQRRQEQESIVRLFIMRPVVVDESPDRRIVSGTLKTDGPPLPLFPPASDLRLTPGGSVLLDQIRWGTLVEAQVSDRGYEALCLARAGLGQDACPPLQRPPLPFGLELFQSRDVDEASAPPPSARPAEPADPRLPRPLY
jgi:type III secretion protein C